MKIGIANLPLHSGHCPKWLFPRMVKLAGAISETVVNEYGEKELLNRLSDPFWFQGFSCILGFDWHSSGTTTTTCGAVKEALKKENTGIFVAGGKGNASKKTPLEIRKISEQLNLPDNKIQKLIYSSKISAKVDNSLVQDSYHLYHHVFVFTEKGDYAVIQQGMNNSNNKNSLLGAIRRLKPAVLRSSLNREFLELKTVGLKSEVLNPPVFNNFARRYHWLSDSIVDFVEEPHSAICCDSTGETLDLTARQSCETRNISVDLINDNPQHIFKFFEEQKSLLDFFCNKKNSKKTLMMPARHWIQEIDLTQKDREILNKAYELQPKNYEELISLKGMGAKKLRALALISDLVYGSEASWKDPVKYSFSHGGKDGTPFPVDKPVFDNSINFLKDALESAKIGNDEKTKAIKRLYTYVSGYQSFGVTAKLL